MMAFHGHFFYLHFIHIFRTYENLSIRSLEKDFGMKVFDRYMVILEIFRHYAKSPEALTQIELAEMRYTRYD